ncbi:MAG TPA: NPXTG-anchored protein, partial [Oscillospiraceae bacterium]|nr:NPXTG-anchored protein [Oscillospiraceae bacterium]
LTLVEKVAVGKGDDEVDVTIKREAGDTLGKYYLSDVELSTETAPAEEEENPNTGVAETAGVAVALAVLTLCSAAAVALKK